MIGPIGCRIFSTGGVGCPVFGGGGNFLYGRLTLLVGGGGGGKVSSICCSRWTSGSRSRLVAAVAVVAAEALVAELVAILSPKALPKILQSLVKCPRLLTSFFFLLVLSISLVIDFLVVFPFHILCVVVVIIVRWFQILDVNMPELPFPLAPEIDDYRRYQPMYSVRPAVFRRQLCVEVVSFFRQ